MYSSEMRVLFFTSYRLIDLIEDNVQAQSTILPHTEVNNFSVTCNATYQRNYTHRHSFSHLSLTFPFLVPPSLYMSLCVCVSLSIFLSLSSFLHYVISHLSIKRLLFMLHISLSLTPPPPPSHLPVSLFIRISISVLIA